MPGVVTEEPLDLWARRTSSGDRSLSPWDTASARRPACSTGRNVVIHEFAHKLDMLDGLIDGTPPVSGREAFER